MPWLFILLGMSGAFAADHTHDHAHVEELEAVEVLDHKGDQGSVVFSTPRVTLKGEDLRKKRRATIGDTLQNEAGVTSTSFGPNASRPVIRGLDGSRIRILQNGLQILDASTQSVDHAIPVDPLIVDQMDIVRGPMSLAYGASGVGGLVNIITNRIHSEYQEGRVSEFQAQGETVTNGLSESGRLDYGKDQWMLHLDASTKNLQNQKIPGYARSAHERSANPLGAGKSEAKYKLPNSQNLQNNLGAGATRFFSRGSLGVAYNHFNTDYGTVAEENVIIRMQQNRWEMSGEYKMDGDFFKKVRLRSSYTDYKHRELENKVTGTLFSNSGLENRLEFLNEGTALRGMSGIQTHMSQFDTKGSEAFLPKVNNTSVAAFTFQEVNLGQNTLNGSARLENTSIRKNASDAFGISDHLGFTGINAATGYQYHFSKANSAGLNYSYTERAPTFQELLAKGAHLATGTFEQGNTGLRKEKSHGVELLFKRQNTDTTINAGVYSQWFKDYISLNPNGLSDPGSQLAIYNYQQVDALIYGFDVDAKTKLREVSKGLLYGLFRADLVRGRDTKNNQNLPRISPPRVTAGMEFVRDRFEADFDLQHVFDQSHNSPNERVTKAYTLTNLGTQYSFIHNNSKVDIFFRIRNLFDVEARSHVSFLKERAPLPGRNFILGVQWLL